MLTIRRLSIALLGALALLAGWTITGPISPAAADEVCYTEELEGGFVNVVCYDPGNGGGGVATESGTKTCTTPSGSEVSCTADGLFWLPSQGCYVEPTPVSTDPTDGNPLWAGRTTGSLHSCLYDIIGSGGAIIWLGAPPAPSPNPYDVARAAVATMRLTMGEVGVTPPLGTVPSVVGVPIWLWVANPAENTTGPITRSATDTGLTVTATATLDRIEWTLRTDRQILSTTCSGSSAGGTPFFDGAGGQNSPTCGWSGTQNNLTGTGQLTGTAYWNVTWTGGGQAGSFGIPGQSRTVPFEITEVQVIRTDGG